MRFIVLKLFFPLGGSILLYPLIYSLDFVTIMIIITEFNCIYVKYLQNKSTSSDPKKNRKSL